MFRKRNIAIVVAIAGIGIASAWLSVRARSRVLFVSGAVLRDDTDPNKQRPISGAAISATIRGSAEASGEATSDGAGYFRFRLSPAAQRGEPIELTIKHSDYEPAEIREVASDRIHVVRLKPKPHLREAAPEEPGIPIANVRVRYALKSTTTIEVGSKVATFEIVNTGNVPCDGQEPCSPDGKWKAAIGSISLDAESNNQFRNGRVSCIAGPCAFTRIEADNFSRGGRVISVSVRNWSDTVTYLIEAEVAHTMPSDQIRHSYPAIFGRSMNFTLPATAQGPSIEAEVEGTNIVFPLGPSLKLSWANCRLETGGQDRARLYRCELKPKYRFK